MAKVFQLENGFAGPAAWLGLTDTIENLDEYPETAKPVLTDDQLARARIKFATDWVIWEAAG